MHEETTERHREEAAFFDAVAQQSRATLAPLDPSVLERYRRTTVDTARFPLEYAIALVRCGDAPRVLDVGCGDGANAALMASLGAHVTGFDISPGSIIIAEERARLCGVAHQTEFIVGSAEDIKTSGDFDVVWCDAVLHHVIPQLDQVLAGLHRVQHTRSRTIFMEPISRSRFIRSVRAAIPLHTDATPGERPLRDPELAAVRRHYPGLITRYFRTLGRADRLVLPNGQLEHAPAISRAFVRSLAAIDHVINQTTLARFASIAVMHTN
jgi:2-polyprenyl-3-methyl-5-hydroxy-6-metoxy-1,4-benzoquinol methylase